MSDPVIQPIQQLSRALTWVASALLLYGVGSWLLAQPVFALHKVDVIAPVSHVTEAQVKLVTDRHVRGNFFTVDLEQVRSAFEKLPWVREARVTRRWPDTLVVSFAEHVPLARWNDAALLNQQGEVFAAALDANLPHLQGPNNSNSEVTQTYLAYQKQLAGVGRSISELQLSPRRAWRLRLDDGTQIMLGRTDAAARLARFTRLYPQLFADAARVPTYVDLRYADGLSVRLSAARSSATPSHPTEL
jgi:cell division protein FtsQ